MERVTAVRKPADYPHPDAETQAGLDELFGALFPGNPAPEFDDAHIGMAIAALNPKMALNLARTSAVIAGQTDWCQRRDLRELAIQTVNVHFRSDYSFRSRLPACEAAGVTTEQLAMLPFWNTSSAFDGEQRLAIEYALAVVTGSVPDHLFRRVVTAWGEKGAVECTALVSYWSFWAMFLNATRPEQDFS